MTKIEAWLKRMYALWGTPYVFGGKNIPRDGGLDCSGLVTSTAPEHCLGKPDFTNADALKSVGPRVALAGAQRGDLVLFEQTFGQFAPGYATHVGVWIRPGWMIDTHDGVHETKFQDGGFWQKHFLGIWRPTIMQEEEDPAVIAELEQKIADLQARLDRELGGAAPFSTT